MVSGEPAIQARASTVVSAAVAVSASVSAAAAVDPATSVSSVSASTGLSRRQRRFARLAGAVGFASITAGLNLAGLLFAFFAAGLLAAGFSDSMTDGSGHVARSVLEAIVDAYAAPVTATAVSAVVLVVLGILTSLRLLRAGVVARRAAVTWSGIGVCLIPNAVAAVVAYFAAWAINSLLWPGSHVGFANDLHVIVVATVLTVIIAAVIGAFAWWWMAQVFSGDEARAKPTRAA